MKLKTIDMTILLTLASMGAIVRNDAVSLDDLYDELLDIQQRIEDIQGKADGENRALTEDEEKDIQVLFKKFDDTTENLNRRKRIQDQSASLQAGVVRRTTPSLPPDPQDGAQPGEFDGQPDHSPRRRPFVDVVRDPMVERGQWGWDNFGQFALAVRAAALPNGAVADPRLLRNAPTTFGQEGVGADGGFLVPPDFRTEIMEAVLAEASLLGRTDQMTSGSNTVVLPKDETTAWQTSGGVQAFWEGEANQLTQSKPQFKTNTHRLNKLTALVPVTEELFEDAAALDSYLRRKVPAKMDFKINDAIINGTGAGMPLGFMNSGSLITVAKASGQAADTVVFDNIVQMYTRLYSPMRTSAIWLINSDIEPQLYSMQFPGTGTAVPVFLPPGGLSASPFATLMGRPVVPSEAMQTLGDLGDIAFVSLLGYLSIMKTGGMRNDVSMHLYFDYDMLAYRFILRVAGAPWLDSPISPKNGSTTKSAFVTLAARA